MQPADLLLLKPMQPSVMEALAGAFTLHRADTAPDPDAFYREIGPRIRAMATGAQAPVDRALIEKLPQLEIVASFGVGYDTIDVGAAAERGIVVTNTPDVLSDEVADLALGLLLATVREIPQADRHLRAGHWPTRTYPLTATLRGRHVGILGLGRIGRAIARRLEGFGVALSYHGRRRQDDVAYAFHTSLLEMARAVDILMIVAPGGPGDERDRQCRDPGGPRPRRDRRQRRPRQPHRRAGADRSPAIGHDPRRGARCLRRRA